MKQDVFRLIGNCNRLLLLKSVLLHLARPLTVALGPSSWSRYGLQLGTTAHIVEQHTACVGGVGRERCEQCLKATALPMTLHIFLGIGKNHICTGRAVEMGKEGLAVVVVVLIVRI